MLAQRLGLPHLRGAGSFVVATFIDCLGTGLFLPFSLLYFTRAVGLPLSTVGLALSIATLIRVPMVPVTGMLVDRFGAKRVVLTSQIVQGAGSLGYLVVQNAAMLVGMLCWLQLDKACFGRLTLPWWHRSPLPMSEIVGTVWQQRCVMLGLASAVC